MTDIPLAPCEKILRRNGAPRVSAEGVREFALVLEGVTADIAKEAAELAQHAGRNTVMVEDVRLARKNRK
ncbi:MAG: NFYB/HAP3 family transcription factor subunit [Candidatus Aenigmatarchaeota archaeon]|nr:MAG: NFYB/HAP3 family transcription factor subunit [Candidatus Aenigmarchaeota archaeon]